MSVHTVSERFGSRFRRHDEHGHRHSRRHRPPRLRFARRGDARRRPPRGGRASALAPGISDSHRPGEVGGRRPCHEPLVRRLRDAPPLLLRRGRRVLREPLPRKPCLPGGARPRQDRLLRVRDRPLPLAVCAGERDVLAEADRQRQRQPHEARRALHLDDRDPDPGRVRCRDPRYGGRSLQAAGTTVHRPPAHGPRDQGDAELRSQARPADQLPVLPAASRRARSPR